MEDIIRKQRLQYHIYAGNAQTYIAFSQLDKNGSPKTKPTMGKYIINMAVQKQNLLWGNV